MRCFAVIPAAGKSVRFGADKLLVDWRGTSLIEWVVGTLRPHVARVVVVVPATATALATAVERAGATVVRSEEPTPDMRATVECGLSWIETVEQPMPSERWFLLPADLPGLTSNVVHELVGAAEANPTIPILQPVWQGQRGHPVLLAWHLVAELRCHPKGQGINQFLAERAELRMEVPIASAGIVHDLDTRSDYERWRGEGEA